MCVVLVTSARYADHVARYSEQLAGQPHPDRAARLEAAVDGITRAGIGEAVVTLEPELAPRTDLERVHSARYLDALDRFCRDGGGAIDINTSASPESYDVAVLAAGA